MGMDRLTNAAVLVAMLVLVAAGCDADSRPDRLLDGETAPGFSPVDGSVVTHTRSVPAAFLGRRFWSCLKTERNRFPSNTLVVERIGVFGQSLTFRDPDGRHLHSCDGGFDPTSERRPPWCGGSI